MESPTLATSPKTKKSRSFTKLAKSLGVLGFLFFLVKGIVWLVLFFGLSRFFGN